MSLTKKDLKDALVLEREQVKKLIDDSRDKIIAYVKVRLDETNYHVKNIKTELEMIRVKLNVLEEKIDSIKKMESEDIEGAYEDIAEIKERLTFVENRLAILKH